MTTSIQDLLHRLSRAAAVGTASFYLLFAAPAHAIQGMPDWAQCAFAIAPACDRGDGPSGGAGDGGGEGGGDGGGEGEGGEGEGEGGDDGEGGETD